MKTFGPAGSYAVEGRPGSGAVPDEQDAAIIQPTQTRMVCPVLLASRVSILAQMDESLVSTRGVCAIHVSTAAS